MMRCNLLNASDNAVVSDEHDTLKNVSSWGLGNVSSVRVEQEGNAICFLFYYYKIFPAPN
jgi:hypothetical protein